MMDNDTKCNSHPDAPHSFDRAASHAAGRFICECEAWDTSDMAHRAGGLSVEQEPVAWMGITDNPYCNDADCNDPNGRAMRWHNKLLSLRKQEHTAPPSKKWVSLTDEEIKAIELEVNPDAFKYLPTLQFARAIEAALNRKNT